MGRVRVMDGGEPARRPSRRARGTAEPARPWVHPSELGHSRRLHADRRRSHRLVLGLVATGAGVLMATAAVASYWSDAPVGPPEPVGASSAAAQTRPDTDISTTSVSSVTTAPMEIEPWGLLVADAGHGGAGASGALVVGVEDGSGASDAGLAKGDVVLSVAETPVPGAEGMREMATAHVHDEVSVELVRDGVRHRVVVPAAVPVG